MDNSLARQQLITFVAQRLVLSPGLTLPFLTQLNQVTVGLAYPDGRQVCFNDAQALGNVLAGDVGFQAIRLGTWLNTPDGALIADAVKQVIPPGYRPEYQLVVDALQFAASKQRQAGWQRAVGTGCLIAFAGAAALFWPRG
jgi:hypothetical protein